MKQKRLITKSIVAIAFIMLFISAIVLCLFQPLTTNNDILTVCSDDGYYSETTYYKNKDEFYSVINKNSNKKAVKASDDAFDKKFVGGIEKKVWVGETYDGNGNIASSRLLRKKEIDELNKKLDGTEYLVTSATHSLGTDETSFYALKIWMTADYDATLDYYTASAFSEWDVNYHSSDKKEIPEKDYEDYAGYTWGGEGTLEASSQRTVCQYYDTSSKKYSNTTASKTLSDSYAGIAWQFLEKKETTNYLKMASSYVNLTKKGNLQNKVTSLKFTYIHTYDVVKGSLSLNLSSNGSFAGGFSLSETEKQWQVEIDLPGFDY